MKLTRTKLAISAIPLAFGMAGCAHDSAPGVGPGTPGTPGISLTAGDVIAKKANDTASNKLNDGGTLKADSTTHSAVMFSFADGGGKVSPASASNFAIKKNSVGGADMTVNGQTISFSAADATGPDDFDKVDANGKSFGLWNYSSDSAKAAIDGTDKNYLQVWGYYADDTTAAGRGFNGFAVVGAETDPSVVKSHANATYLGDARAETELASNVNEKTTVKGKLTLNADFQQGSVSGKIDNLKGRVQGAETGGKWTQYQDAAAGTNIEMTKAQISANGFAGGKLVAHDPGGAIGSLEGSTYSGRFYGPDADQVGGVMAIQGSDPDGKFVGTGYFAGQKQK